MTTLASHRDRRVPLWRWKWIKRWHNLRCAECRVALAAQQVEKDPDPVIREPWEARAYRQAEKVIRAVWDEHSRPRIGGSFGSGPIGASFYCDSCRAPWPCTTFQLVADFGTLDDHPNGYKPLRLERVESVTEGGLTGAATCGRTGQPASTCQCRWHRSLGARPDLDPLQDAAECPDCCGTGAVTVEFHHGEQEQDCPTCDGTGVQGG